MRDVNDPSAELIAGFIQGFVLSCFLYYVEDDPVWSDREFDECCGFLNYWRRLWPADFAARVGDDIKTAAHGLSFTDEEKEAARAWRLEGGHWPPEPPTITALSAFDDLF